jgi:hypothetical protein
MVPGFTIDTGSSGTGEADTLRVELFHAEEVPASKIQKKGLEAMTEYEVDVYGVSEHPGKFHSAQVAVVPTTRAMDGEYEIERWERPTHADDILGVLDSW